MGKSLYQLYDRIHEAIASDLAHTVELLVGHLPKCEELVVAYGDGHFRELNPRGSSMKRSSDLSEFWQTVIFQLHTDM